MKRNYFKCFRKFFQKYTFKILFDGPKSINNDNLLKRMKKEFVELLNAKKIMRIDT